MATERRQKTLLMTIHFRRQIQMLKNLYQAGSTPGTGNIFVNNKGLNLYEQSGVLGQYFSISGYFDKLRSNYQIVTGGASIAPDFGLLTGTGVATDGTPNGNTVMITLDQNITVNPPTNLGPGERFAFIFIQNGTGGYTVSFDVTYKVAWSDTGNTAGLRSSIEFWNGPLGYEQINAQSPYH